MCDISPEDFKWSNDLPPVNFLNYKKHLSNKDGQCETILNDGMLKTYKKLETMSSVNRSTNNIDYKTQRSLKTPIESSYKALLFENDISETALKCLYQTERDMQSLVQTDIGRGETLLRPENLEIPVDFNDQPLDYCYPNVYSNVCGDNELEKPSLYAETISLIRDGITSLSGSQDQVLSNDEDERELLINNQIDCLFDRIFSSSGHCEGKQINRNNVITNSETVNYPVFSSEETVDVNCLSFPGLTAFTPGGQVYKLSKESTADPKLKVIGNVNLLKVAIELNHCKQMVQIQNGIFLPECLDFDKEEMFNSWLKEEREKTQRLFENFNIEFNIRCISLQQWIMKGVFHDSQLKCHTNPQEHCSTVHLTAERELLKLDRCLKQYTVINPCYTLEVLQLFEKTDIELNDILRIPQVYETILKVTKFYKIGNLKKKARETLKKFKSLISPPEGIKAEDYIKKLCIKRDIGKMKTTAISECIVNSNVLKL